MAQRGRELLVQLCWDMDLSIPLVSVLCGLEW